ncbi:hypothetical protein [Marinomonas pollencensis]|uniref:Uncharacterized protein n=1 Tax=Marinomonas pollencensis TaxID=491954 RepID=A0A3E0DTB7_9GAMM|nr:hypothetical protein [Marinomonas pollencensis]REG86730.1 hypothetical protein DFP81_101295 [Marinomonas pollencensis]
MFDFSDSLSDGKDKADELLSLKEGFNSVFSTLQENLSSFIERDVKLEHYHEVEGGDLSPFMAATVQIGMLYGNNKDIKKRTGYFEVRLTEKGSDNPYKVLFKYKESSNVYPINIVFQRNEMVCSNQVELIDVMKEIVSSGHFNLRIREFVDALNK